MALNGFMKMSYASCEAARDDTGVPEDIVQSGRGHIIFPKALLDFSTDLRHMLALITIPGNLHWRGSRSLLLREDFYIERPVSQDPVFYNFFSLENKFIHQQTAVRKGSFEVRLQAAMDCPLLFLRADVVYVSAGVRLRHSVGAAQKNLALALRPKRSNRPLADLEKELRRKSIPVWQRDPTVLDSAVLDSEIPHRLHPRTRNHLNPASQCQDTRSISTYTGNPAVDFLRAGLIADYFPMVLQGDALILECIMLAEETFGDRWTILAEP